MTTGAILLMVLTMGTVASFTIYFFIKILKAPLPGPDDDREEKPS